MNKKIHILYDDPIIIQPDTRPADESTAPTGTGANPFGFLIAGSIVVVLCLWWLAPEWLGSIWKNLIKQMFDGIGH